VKLPYAGISEERLWRDDHIYDVIVVIGYNDAPVVDGRGKCDFSAWRSRQLCPKRRLCRRLDT